MISLFAEVNGVTIYIYGVIDFEISGEEEDVGQLGELVGHQDGGLVQHRSHGQVGQDVLCLVQRGVIIHC